jgi:anti-anti-sigma factor
MTTTDLVRHRDGVAVVDLPAQVDSSTERALNDAYATATANGSRRLLLNFASVEFLSSTGIAMIVGILARAKKEAREISACGLSEHYREIFEITRLADFMRLYADEPAALAATRDDNKAGG